MAKAIRALLVELLDDVCRLTPRCVATLQTICREVGCDFQQRLCSPIFCTAVVVLWLALHRERFPLLADTLQAAAGVAGKQRWALILPSSAWVSFVTYITVIAVRYPLNWTLCRMVSWPLATISLAPRAHMVVFSLSSGTRPLPTCMLSLTLAVLSNGYKVSSA